MADISQPHRGEVHIGVARRLGELYAVAAGLALAAALERSVSAGDEYGWIASGSAALLAAFIVTLIPFYHGSMRHVDEQRTRGEPVAAGLMLSDFLGLFLQAAGLFVLGREIPSTSGFCQWYAILLVIDIVWATVFITGSYLSGRRRQSPSEASKQLRVNLNPIGQGAGAWLWLNLATLVVLGVIFVIPGDMTPLAILIVAVIRSALDYGIGWSFYFPHASTNLVSVFRRHRSP